MTKWTVGYSKQVNELNLKLTKRAERDMAEQRLTKTDLILILTNSSWRQEDGHLLYNFQDEGIPLERMERAWGAGLDDVTAALNPRNCKIVATARGWRKPRFQARPRWTQPPPALPWATTDDGLILTNHVRERMKQRQLTREELTYVILFGTCLNRHGQVFYTLRRKDDNGAMTRLNGTTLVMPHESAVVITAWRDRRTGYRRLRRKSKRRPTLFRPVTPPHLFH